MSEESRKEAKELLEYLATHNKNLTKRQYYYILRLQEILAEQ